MNRTKETTKREKVLVTLPENYINALDNKIDNILIRTRGDAIISLLAELQKVNPSALKFDVPAPPHKQLSDKVIENINNIIEGDILTMTENQAMITLDDLKTWAKVGKTIGYDGVRQLRELRIARKKAAEAEQGAT
ncbi:MAG: hypothetical protein Q8M94_20745 [Ignavibacteria bacterium]|nr:hypothetical protein [Ignavibacteria bacterium]